MFDDDLYYFQRSSISCVNTEVSCRGNAGHLASFGLFAVCSLKTFMMTCLSNKGDTVFDDKHSGENSSEKTQSSEAAGIADFLIVVVALFNA